MTTVAYDGRYIAADGRSSVGGTVAYDSHNKIYVNGDRVFALCGGSSNCMQFSSCFVEGMECHNKENDSGGFMLENGVVYLVFVDEDTKKYRKDTMAMNKWADGSGRDRAIAAMDFGRDAISAVKYAMTRDMKSGGKITCYDTKTKKFIKVKQ